MPHRFPNEPDDFYEWKYDSASEKVHRANDLMKRMTIDP